MVVVGAGVIGLSTAIRLAESGRRVRLWAAEEPQRTTSAVAGALWGPDFAEPGFRWSLITRNELIRLTDVPGSGVHWCRGRQVSDITTEPPPWITELPEVRMCTPDELPDGMLVGMRTRVPIVDMPAYLDYLSTRLADAGTRIELREVSALEEAAAAAPVVVNCTGLGARELAGDSTLYPVRGQHVVVRNPGVEEFYFEARTTPEWAGFFPHGEHVVLGGIAQANQWNLEPDPVVAEAIVSRCAAIEPRLADAQVIAHCVGLRPTRKTPRLAQEERDGVRYVHNYGHGGIGVSLSWGCANAVVQLLS